MHSLTSITEPSCRMVLFAVLHSRDLSAKRKKIFKFMTSFYEHLTAHHIKKGPFCKLKASEILVPIGEALEDSAQDLNESSRGAHVLEHGFEKSGEL